MINILVPTDFSEVSEYGIRAAFEIARKKQAKIYLLNVIFPFAGPEYSGSPEVNDTPFAESYQYINELEEANTKQLEQLVEKYRYEHVPVEPLLKVNSLQDAIDETLEEKKIHLLVMGTEGKTTILDNIAGSNTEQAVRISTCPVLSVKKPLTRFDPKSIVLAINLEENLERGIKNIQKFAEIFGSKIHLLYVIQSDDIGIDTALNKLEALAKKYVLQNYSINTIAHEDIEEGISYFTRRKKADLISVITDGTSALSSLLLGSVAEDLVKEETYPVLTYNTEA
ncbi:MAG: universal stress protein [Bacteroidales bacterium]|nr:universal stress protein [Bacteroidales bacterium]